MLASKISLDQAKSNKLFYFVANVVVYHPEKERVLLLKRSESEKVFPNLWAMLGGKLEHEDFNLASPDATLNNETVSFWNPIEKLLKREVREEANITVSDQMSYLRSVMFVRPDGVLVIMPVFIAEYRSGTVKPEKGAFTDYAWVNEEEITHYDCIPSIVEEAKAALKLCRQRKGTG